MKGFASFDHILTGAARAPLLVLAGSQRAFVSKVDQDVLCEAQMKILNRRIY